MAENTDPAGQRSSAAKVTSLLKEYQPFLAPLIGKSISLLELGIWRGESLRYWRDYLANATIVGLDCSPVRVDDPGGMIYVYQGYQQDLDLLDRIAKERAPDGFDVVIDDCSHIGRLTRISFWHLFQNHLKPGGLYAIEDWTTGYLRSWPDGRRYGRKPRLQYPCRDGLLDRFTFGCSPYFSGESAGGGRYGDPSSHYGARRLGIMASRLLFGSRIPSHTYGMVGFAKELLDACALGEKAIPRSGGGRYSGYGINRIDIRPEVIFVSKSKEPDARR
jgi:hypothetical protein